MNIVSHHHRINHRRLYLVAEDLIYAAEYKSSKYLPIIPKQRTFELLPCSIGRLLFTL